MADVNDIVTKLGDGNQLMGQLIQTISDRPSGGITGVVPIISGGTGATIAADARTNLGLAIGSNVQSYINYLNYASLPIRSITYVIDGGGAPILTGLAGAIEVPFACTLNRVTMLADQTGSIVVDVRAGAYSAYPTASSICASAKPTISASDKSQDSTLTGWTTSVSAGDVLQFTVDSISTITRCTIALRAAIA